MLKIKQKLNKSMKEAKLEKVACLRYIPLKFKAISVQVKKRVEFGAPSKHQLGVVVLACLIAFTGYVLLFKQYYSKIFIVKQVHIEKRFLMETEKEKLRKDLKAMVAGHPIELMIPFIIEKDRKTAAYLIGIAKKESNWGKRKPILDGQDCYNYWGFRAKRERMGSGGHTCFDNPREAVAVVSRRIAEIIDRNEVESAHDMLVWKCGSNCAITGGQIAADKWAVDVDIYADKLLN